MLELGASGGKHHGSPIPDEMENIPLSTPSNITQQGTDTSGKLAKCWHHYRKHIILASILLGITALIILIACVAHHVSNIGVKWQGVSQNKTLSAEMEEMLMDHRNNTVVNITHGIFESPDEVMVNEESMAKRDTGALDINLHEESKVRRRKRESPHIHEILHPSNYNGLSSDYGKDSEYSSEEDDDDNLVIQLGYQNLDTPQYYTDLKIMQVQTPNREGNYVNEQNSYNIISSNEVPQIYLKFGSPQDNTFKSQNLLPKPIYREEKERSKLITTEKLEMSQQVAQNENSYVEKPDMLMDRKNNSVVNITQGISTDSNEDISKEEQEEERALHRNKSQSSTLFPGIQHSMSVVQSAINSFRPPMSDVAQQSPLNNVKTMLDVIAGSNLSTELSKDLKEDFESNENCDEKLNSIHKHIDEIQREIKELSDSLLVMRAKSLIRKQNNSSFVPRKMDDKWKADIIKKVENYWKNYVSDEETYNTLKNLTGLPKSVLNYISRTVEAEMSRPGSEVQALNVNPNKGNLDTVIDAIEVTSSHADIAVNQDSGNFSILDNSDPENLQMVHPNPRIVAPQATVRPVFEGSAIAGESLKTSHQLALTPTGMSWTPVCMYSSLSPSGVGASFPTQPGFVTKTQGVPYWPYPMMHQQQNFYHFVPMQMKQTQGMQTFPQFSGQKPLFCTYLPPPTFQFPVVPGTAPADISFRQESVAHKGSKTVEVLSEESSVEQEISEMKGKADENSPKMPNKTIDAKNSGVLVEPQPQQTIIPHSVDENVVEKDLEQLERLGKDIANTAN